MSKKLAVGIDLGTSKTAIVTSDSRRICVPTAVGRPKDRIARRVTGRESVVGDDLKHPSLSLDVIRPLSGAQFKYERRGDDASVEQAVLSDLHLILQHSMNRLGIDQAEVSQCVIGVPSRAELPAQQFVLDVGRRVCPQAIVVPEPFAVAYGIGHLSDALIVDIGAGTIDICPMVGTYPMTESQVTVGTGGDAVDRAITESLLEMLPEAVFRADEIRELKERYGSVAVEGEEVLVTLTVAGRPQRVDFGPALREGCRLIMQPVVDGIFEALESYDYQTQKALLGRIVLAGGGGQVHGLDAHVEMQLRKEFGEARVQKVHDFVYAGAHGALRLAVDMPAEHWDSLKSAA